MRNLNSHRGIGLLELMLSIIVITAIVVGATKYYLVAKEAMRIAQAEEIINNISQAAYTWLEGHNSFCELDQNLGALVTAGLLPAKYAQPNSDPWGGDTVLWKCRQYVGFWLQVELHGVPAKACQMLQNKYGKPCASITDWNGVTVCTDTGDGPDNVNCRFLFRGAE